MVDLFREAMVKMREVYQTNPKLGDAAALDSKLEANTRALESLDSELVKFEVSIQHVTLDIEGV